MWRSISIFRPAPRSGFIVLLYSSSNASRQETHSSMLVSNLVALSWFLLALVATLKKMWHIHSPMHSHATTI